MKPKIEELEILGEGGSGNHVRYYWDDKSQKYYMSFPKSLIGKNQLYEVKVVSTLQELKSKYPRGEDAIDTESPYSNLEVNPIADYGAAVSSEGTSLRFPHDMLIDQGEDFVMFDFYDYRPPFKGKVYGGKGQEVINQTLAQYNASGYANEYFKDKAYKQILMYMPQDVQDVFSAKWEGKKFGALTTGLVAAAGQGEVKSKLRGIVDTATDAVSKGRANAAAEMITKLANTITGDTISTGDVFGGISGVARNPNMELLFQSMELRTFDLTFKMAPYDQTDVSNMNDIIKTFKKAMLPQYKLGEGVKVFGMENDALEGGFIQVPKVCAVNFMRGASRNNYLPRYKMCAITDVNVNYTPDNVYATFDRSSPVATELKLSFMETKLVFSEDIEERGF